ncbi:MAG TPA: hypothetical protein VN622_08490 [Clostridia bacterium]|nr:hypothetical protein [Clostridia bacterium]
MIDKLDVRIPSDAPFHPEFNRLYSDLRYEPDKDPFRRTKHYELVGDLREYGHDAILHMSCKWGKRGDHKLELVDTGVMSFSRLVNEIESVFQIDGKGTEVMRLDLAADVKDVPVSWFQSRIKAQHKRYLANFGSAKFVEMGKGGIQTLYFGKRPNLFRIYDKHAEYLEQYKALLRRLKSDAQIPTFEEFCGLPENGVVLTRVERQIGGGRIPEELATVGKLKNLENFEPFRNLRFVMGGAGEPSEDDYPFETFCTGMYLREKAEKEGMQATHRFISKASKRNTSWALEKYKDFLPPEHETVTANTHHLNELFRQSVTRQLSV